MGGETDRRKWKECKEGREIIEYERSQKDYY